MLTIDDGARKIRPEEYGFRALMDHDVSHVAEMNTVVQNIPGMVGTIPIKQNVGSKEITVLFRRLDMQEMKATADTERLLDVLFDDMYRAKPLKIIMDYDQDKYLNVYVSGNVESTRRSLVSEMPLTFIAYDPRRYSVVNVDEVTWGSKELTFASTAYTFGHKNPETRHLITEPKTIQLPVMGLALQPYISIWGKATNLVITNQGKRIQAGTFLNVRIEIDCEKYIAYEAGVEKMIRMDKFFLRQGMNNVSFSGTGLDLDVTIKYRDRWK